MTGDSKSWQDHAAALVAALTDSGDLHDPAWAAAIATTPRHELVTTAYQRQADGSWTEVDTRGGDGLALVYSPATLVTQIDTEAGRRTGSGATGRPGALGVKTLPREQGLAPVHQGVCTMGALRLPTTPSLLTGAGGRTT